VWDLAKAHDGGAVQERANQKSLILVPVTMSRGQIDPTDGRTHDAKGVVGRGLTRDEDLIKEYMHAGGESLTNTAKRVGQDGAMVKRVLPEMEDMVREELGLGLQKAILELKPLTAIEAATTDGRSAAPSGTPPRRS
jgi:hypothetical protein